MVSISYVLFISDCIIFTINVKPIELLCTICMQSISLTFLLISGEDISAFEIMQDIRCAVAM